MNKRQSEMDEGSETENEDIDLPIVCFHSAPVKPASSGDQPIGAGDLAMSRLAAQRVHAELLRHELSPGRDPEPPALDVVTAPPLPSPPPAPQLGDCSALGAGGRVLAALVACPRARAPQLISAVERHARRACLGEGARWEGGVWAALCVGGALGLSASAPRIAHAYVHACFAPTTDVVTAAEQVCAALGEWCGGAASAAVWCSNEDACSRLRQALGQAALAGACGGSRDLHVAWGTLVEGGAGGSRTLEAVGAAWRGAQRHDWAALARRMHHLPSHHTHTHKTRVLLSKLSLVWPSDAAVRNDSEEKLIDNEATL